MRGHRRRVGTRCDDELSVTQGVQRGLHGARRPSHTGRARGSDRLFFTARLRLRERRGDLR